MCKLQQSHPHLPKWPVQSQTSAGKAESITHVPFPGFCFRSVFVLLTNFNSAPLHQVCLKTKTQIYLVPFPNSRHSVSSTFPANLLLYLLHVYFSILLFERLTYVFEKQSYKRIFLPQSLPKWLHWPSEARNQERLTGSQHRSRNSSIWVTLHCLPTGISWELDQKQQPHGMPALQVHHSMDLLPPSHSTRSTPQQLRRRSPSP